MSSRLMSACNRTTGFEIVTGFGIRLITFAGGTTLAKL